MKKFRTKPKVIEAIQWQRTNKQEVMDFMRTQNGDNVFDFDDENSLEPELVIIHTLEGDVIASPGDWIIKGIAGEFYPCKPDIFRRSYEPTE